MHRPLPNSAAHSNETLPWRGEEILFAPMEGITTFAMRRVHHRCFPGIDGYYTPFLSANQTLQFKRKERRDILPENNEGIRLVPQILGNKANETAWAIQAVADYGYTEVNFNLGCPMATVAGRGKGAGFLFPPDRLDRFFDELFECLEGTCRPEISVKTRIGVQDGAESRQLIEIYNRYPISQLIIHPRLQKDLYRGHPDLDAFAVMLEKSRHPVIYNGDILTTEDLALILDRFPQVKGVMIGRGLLRDPSLIRQIRGGEGITPEELYAYERALYREILGVLGSDSQTVSRMKEIWVYMKSLFSKGGRFSKDPEGACAPRIPTDIRSEDKLLPDYYEENRSRAIRNLLKSRTKEQYQEALDRLFDTIR